MTNINYCIIGERIKKAREQAGYTLSKVAEKCGVEQYQTVSKWEKACTLPSLKSLLDLCDLFHCDIGYLIGEHEDLTRKATDIRAEIGLSESAINRLHAICSTDIVDDPERSKALRSVCLFLLNDLITSDNFMSLAVLYNHVLTGGNTQTYFIVDEHGNIADKIGDNAAYLLLVRAFNSFLEETKRKMEEKHG